MVILIYILRLGIINKLYFWYEYKTIKVETYKIHVASDKIQGLENAIQYLKLRISYQLYIITTHFVFLDIQVSFMISLTKKYHGELLTH